MTILFIIINYFTQNIPFLIGSSPLANSSQPAGIDQGPIISALAKKLFVCHHQCFKNADGLSRFYNFIFVPCQMGQSSKATKSPKKWKRDFFLLIICCKAIILFIK